MNWSETDIICQMGCSRATVRRIADCLGLAAADRGERWLAYSQTEAEKIMNAIQQKRNQRIKKQTDVKTRSCANTRPFWEVNP